MMETREKRQKKMIEKKDENEEKNWKISKKEKRHPARNEGSS